MTLDSLNLADSPVTLFVLIVTIVTSIIAWNKEDLLHSFMLHPYTFVRQKRWHTLFTSGLIHGDPPHLIFNMISFYFFALPMEATIGSARFAIIYFISLAVSDIQTIFKQRNNPDYYCLGASGAVTAVIFSYIIFYPMSKISLFLLPFGLPAPVFGALYIAYSYYSARNPNSHINHSAHLWGAVSGLLLTFIMFPGAYSEFVYQIRQLF